MPTGLLQGISKRFALNYTCKSLKSHCTLVILLFASQMMAFGAITRQRGLAYLSSGGKIFEDVVTPLNKAKSLLGNSGERWMVLRSIPQPYGVRNPMMDTAYPTYQQDAYTYSQYPTVAPSQPSGFNYQTPYRTPYGHSGISGGYHSQFGGYNSRFGTGPRAGPRFTSFDIPLTKIDWSREKLVEIKKDFYDLSVEADSRPGDEIEEILRRHKIVIDGDLPLPKPVNTFDEAVFNEPIQRLIRESQFLEPTPIQKVGWTSCLTGRDVVGVSQTGSGKTLAFLLPGLLHLLAQPPITPGTGPIVLVLAPTRELCQQISKEAQRYLSAFNLKCATIYGGVSKLAQANEVSEGVHVMVATPGRLLDLLSTNTVRLNRVSYFVLDEADRMLDMGFEPQIRTIYGQVRPDRQTLMFSATWPKGIKALAKDFCKTNCIHIQVGDLDLTVNPNITQHIKVVSLRENRPVLFSFLEKEYGKRILIFCDQKKMCDDLVNELRYRNFAAYAIHGNKTQMARDRTLHGFREGQFNILVATDVAARGLDIKDIDFVVNMDTPRTVEDYLHRIGRTGRANKRGESLLLINRDYLDQPKWAFLQKLVGLLESAGQPVPKELTELLSMQMRCLVGTLKEAPSISLIVAVSTCISSTTAGI